MEAETLSFSEFAKRLGVSKARISQMKNEGKLVLTEDGKRVLVQPSIEKIGADTNPAKARAESPPSDAGLSYQAAKTVRERYLALKAKAEYEQSQGILIEKALAISAIKSVMALVRMNMEALPSTISTELAQMSDESVVYQVLARQIETVLGVAAKELEENTK